MTQFCDILILPEQIPDLTTENYMSNCEVPSNPFLLSFDIFTHRFVKLLEHHFIILLACHQFPKNLIGTL